MTSETQWLTPKEAAVFTGLGVSTSEPKCAWRKRGRPSVARSRTPSDIRSGRWPMDGLEARSAGGGINEMPGKRKARLFTELLNLVPREFSATSRCTVSEALFSPTKTREENPAKYRSAGK